MFCRALHRVAQLNGISPTQGNWRHGSMAWRITYLMLPRATGGRRHPIDRQVRWIKVGLWMALAVAAAVQCPSILLAVAFGRAAVIRRLPMTAQRVAIVTGASSGIGLETAVAFARRVLRGGPGRPAGRPAGQVADQCRAGGR